MNNAKNKTKKYAYTYSYQFDQFYSVITDNCRRDYTFFLGDFHIEKLNDRSDT